MDSICAILNKHGSGVLYFGVRPDGEVLGQDVEESTLRRVSQAIGNAIAPPIRPTITRKTSDDGRSYVEVRFSGDEAPYSSNGRFRIRVADEDLLMSPPRFAQWLSMPRRNRNPGMAGPRRADERRRGTGPHRLRHSRQRMRQDKLQLRWRRRRLERLGLLTPDGKLTNAAAVLFCRSRTPMLKMGVLAPATGSTSSMSNRSKGRSSTSPAKRSSTCCRTSAGGSSSRGRASNEKRCPSSRCPRFARQS